jgi:hypothetical protein
MFAGEGSKKETRPQYISIVRGPAVLAGRVGRSGGFSETNRIHDSAGRENVEYLKDDKVDAIVDAVVKSREEVYIPGTEDHKIKYL